MRMRHKLRTDSKKGRFDEVVYAASPPPRYAPYDGPKDTGARVKLLGHAEVRPTGGREWARERAVKFGGGKGEVKAGAFVTEIQMGMQRWCGWGETDGSGARTDLMNEDLGNDRGKERRATGGKHADEGCETASTCKRGEGSEQ